MNVTLVLIGFALAVLMGAGLSALLTTLTPGWSARRRLLTAASVLPALTAAATVAGVLFVRSSDHGQGERMEELATAALMTIGGGFTMLALAGGLVGAFLSQRRGR